MDPLVIILTLLVCSPVLLLYKWDKERIKTQEFSEPVEEEVDHQAILNKKCHDYLKGDHW